jgi:hypothetical protein
MGSTSSRVPVQRRELRERCCPSPTPSAPTKAGLMSRASGPHLPGSSTIWVAKRRLKTATATSRRRHPRRIVAVLHVKVRDRSLRSDQDQAGQLRSRRLVSRAPSRRY